MATLFIDEADVKGLGFVSNEIDTAKITPYIEIAQDKYIEDELGTALSSDLKDGIENTNLTAEETTLIDNYITPALKWWVVVEMLPFISFQITNKGAINRIGEMSEPVSPEDSRVTREHAKDNAERYQNIMINFLKDNFSDYPSYKPERESRTAYKNAFKSSFYFGDPAKDEGYDDSFNQWSKP